MTRGGFVRFVLMAGLTLGANAAIVYFMSRVNEVSTERRQEELLHLDFSRLPPTPPAPPRRSEPRTPPERDSEAAPEALPTLDLDFAAAPSTPGLEGESAYLDLALPSAPSLGPAVTVHTRIAIAEQAADPSAAALGPQMQGFRVYDQLDEPLRPRGSNPDPRYPPHALRRKLEGAVTVEMLINERGSVIDTRIVSGNEPFSDSVVAAVRAWTFTEPRFRGKPVQIWGVKTFRFQIPAREGTP